MPTQYPLTPTTLPLYPGGYQGALLLYNVGPGMAYVSDSPNVTASNGWPIAKGSTITWAAGRALYAISDTTATLFADENAGSMTSAVDVADALIDSGLANDIAQQVALQGAPSIDHPTVLYSKTGTVAANSSWNLGLDTSTWIDISKYNSIFIHVTANAQAPPNVADSFVCSAWTTSNTVAPVTASTALTIESVECALTQEVPDSNGSWCQMVLPAYGEGLFLYFEPVSAGSYMINYTITITGSYKSVTGSKMYAQNQHFLNAGNMPLLDTPVIPGLDNMCYGFVYTIPANTGAYVGVMSHINTQYDVTWVPNTGTTPVNGTDIYISTGEPNRQIVGVYADKSAAGAITRWERILNGGRAPHLWINNHDSFAKSYNFVFSFCR